MVKITDENPPGYIFTHLLRPDVEAGLRDPDCALWRRIEDDESFYDSAHRQAFWINGVVLNMRAFVFRTMIKRPFDFRKEPNPIIEISHQLIWVGQLFGSDMRASHHDLLRGDPDSPIFCTSEIYWKVTDCK